MDFAQIGGIDGRRISADAFQEEYGADWLAKDAIPYCGGCGAVLQPYGMSSPNGIKRFDHPDRAPGADAADECVHAWRDDRRSGLVPTAYDPERGKELRSRFFDQGLAAAYAFCHRRAGTGNLSVDVFHDLVHRADRRRIWCYAGLEEYVVPAVLLTLSDFTGRTWNGGEFEFRFSFRHPKGLGRSAVLDHPRRCELLKVFADGTAMAGRDNPLPLMHERMLAFSGDCSWVRPDLLRRLRAAA